MRLKTASEDRANEKGLAASKSADVVNDRAHDAGGMPFARRGLSVPLGAHQLTAQMLRLAAPVKISGSEAGEQGDVDD